MSFHNVHDISFVTGNFNVDRSWIGLTTNRADGWMWSDSTAVQVCIVVLSEAKFRKLSTQTGKKVNHLKTTKTALRCIKTVFGMMLSVGTQKVSTQK